MAGAAGCVRCTSSSVAFIFCLVLITLTSSNGFPMQFWKDSPPDQDGDSKSTSCTAQRETQFANVCNLTLSPESAKKLTDLIEDDHALAVFMFLTIGNVTTPGVSSELESKTDLQLPPEKWAWIRGKRGRFLATLPYDFDILSLTILTRDVYELYSLNITAAPSECFANFSLACVHKAIAKSFLGNLNVIADAKSSNVCVKVLDQGTGFSGLKEDEYLCFEELPNGSVTSTKSIGNNEWITLALDMLWILSLVFGLFAPLLFKYFPKESRKVPRAKSKGMHREGSELSLSESQESHKTSRPLLIAKDDGIIDILRTKMESVILSRFCRSLSVVLLSSLPVLQAALYWYLKKKEVTVSRKVLGVGDAFVTLIQPDGKYTLVALYCFCVLLLCIVFSSPKNLSDLTRRLSGRKDERSFLGFRKPTKLVCSSDKRGFHLLYENMIFHLTCILSFKFWMFVLHVVTYPWQKVCGVNCFVDPDDLSIEERPEGETEPAGKVLTTLNIIFLIFTYPFWVVTVLSAFILYVIPVTYVAFRIWKMLFRVEIECGCCNFIPVCCKIMAFPLLYIFFIVFCILVEASYFMLAVILTFNIMFLGSVCGFTVLGLLFYINFYIPYIILGFWILVFILRAFQKFHAQYVSLKNMIFEECENYDSTVKMAEANIRESFSGGEPRSASTPSITRAKSVLFLVFVDEFAVPSIPLELFLQVNSRVLPFKRIILAKLLKVCAVCSYLTVVFSFVMALNEFEAASPALQGLAILFLGGLPLLMPRHDQELVDAEGKRLRFLINEVINEYCKRFS